MDSEKAVHSQLEKGNESPPLGDGEKKVLDNRFRDLPPDPDEGLSEAEKAKIDKALLLKLDLKLIPWLCLIYLAAFLDRKWFYSVQQEDRADRNQVPTSAMRSLQAFRKTYTCRLMDRSTMQRCRFSSFRTRSSSRLQMLC